MKISEPIHVDENSFERFVLKNEETPVVVDFWAKWCGPCKMIAPALDTLAKEFEGKILVVKVDADQNQGLLATYGIAGIPTLLFFHQGEIVGRHTGAVALSELRDKFNEVLTKTQA